MKVHACSILVGLVHAIVSAVHSPPVSAITRRASLRMIESDTHAGQPKSKADRRAMKGKIRKYLVFIDGCGDSPCEHECAAALSILREMRDEGLPLQMHAQTKTMLLCAQRADVVQALFDELVEASIASEGSYAALIRCQVANGERHAALRTFLKLVDDEATPVRVRTCAPLLEALSAADEREQVLAMWNRARSRGVHFGPSEYCMVLRMLGRLGDVVEFWRMMSSLLASHPNPDEQIASELTAAIQMCISAVGGDTLSLAHACVSQSGEVVLQPASSPLSRAESEDVAAPTDEHAQVTAGQGKGGVGQRDAEVAREEGEMGEVDREEVVGKLQLFRLSEEQRAAVRNVLLERAAARSEAQRRMMVTFDRSSPPHHNHQHTHSNKCDCTLARARTYTRSRARARSFTLTHTCKATFCCALPRMPFI